ncbi:MAG TPA: hypothetical protein VHL58_18750, partial [Thermoanaerobaculia bacterium]|nr:hypothetical protein [Thermoanaerobaculia bacterium]
MSPLQRDVRTLARLEGTEAIATGSGYGSPSARYVAPIAKMLNRAVPLRILPKQSKNGTTQGRNHAKVDLVVQRFSDIC